jgi:beta-barrel assembly-enhancing protease
MLATSSCLAFADDFQNRVQFSVPEIGSGVGLIDQHKERMIGEKVYRQVQKQMPVLHDPWLEDQLYFSFSHILSQTQLAQEPVGLVLINDPQINAFAVPGGLFALNTGMITAAKRMDEVASVMAHEIAHVTQRHYSRSQEAFKGQGLLSMAGILVGALVASQADGDVGAAVMMGSQAAMVDRQLSYSRDQEREADRIGMQYMYAAGYNPHGMADFFEIMHRATSRVSFIPDFWYTHPLTTERMSEARLRASQLPPQKSPLNDENFEVLRWYSKVLAGQTTEDELKLMSGRGVLAAEFALSKFYIQQGDFTKAQYFLNQAKARSSVGNSNLVVILQTDIYLGQKAYPLAHQAIRQSAVLMPENRALVLKQAEVLIRMGKPEQAQPLLQRFLRQNSRDVSALQLMFQAANAEPASPLKAVNVLRHRAELEFWTGNEEEAIKSMLHAERLSKNNQAMSAQIQQRLKEMQQDRRYKI